MNEQSPMNDPVDRCEARRQRREARLADPSRPGTWVAGVILILLGTLFFLNNTGTFDFPLKNWWALFILIPAIGSFDSALRMYRSAGNQFTAPAQGSLLVGLVLSLVTVIFLFGLKMSYFGPILIILVGVGILLTAMTSKSE